MILRPSALVAIALGFLSVGASGCDKLLHRDKDKSADDDDDSSSKKKKHASSDDSASASLSASAAPSASASSDASGGPMIVIPAGSLRAGDACGAVPRVTDEELVWPSVALNGFSIDVYPYPNDPSQPAHTGVTQAEASTLCQARQKRLCSELEWERSCKGPENKTFEYGVQYQKDDCKLLSSLMPNARSKCGSDFGVKDMHGLVYEWTSSDWGRGKSGLVATRGNGEVGNVVRERCASGQGRAPGDSSKEVGFRCCSGPENGPVVDLRLDHQAPITEDPSIDPTLAAAMLKAMPKDHQSVDNATVKFDKLWRWHPRDNEELLIGRWSGRSQKGTTWAELAVFKVCGETPARIASMKGPVSRIGAPTVGTNLEKASATAETKTGKASDKSSPDKGSLTMTYWYGSVKIDDPTFVKPGNSLPDDDAKVSVRPSIVRPTLIKH